MPSFAFDHLANSSLIDGTRSLRGQDRLTTALIVARLAEIDHRRIGEFAGYRTTTAWCIVELGYSEDEASRRCRAARFGRCFPVLFEALADGRLHLTAVNLIGPHLSEATVDEWVALATRKTSAEIRSLIAIHRPRPDGPDGIVELPDSVLDEISDRVMPTAPQRCLFQCSGSDALRALFEEARELMSHQNPSGKYEPVLVEALQLLVAAQKKQKFEATGSKGDPDYISAEVKRQVWERDGGACTYRGEDGRRCGSRWQVEFDHVDMVALGGEGTVDKIRCLCRVHNQLEADRRLGPEFMAEKRRAAKAERARRREFRAGAEEVASAAAEFRAGAEESPGRGAGSRAGAEFRAGAEESPEPGTGSRAGAEWVSDPAVPYVAA